MKRNPLFLATAAVATCLLLSACDGDDDSTGTNSATLHGTAAVGTPIVGGAVKVSCAGGDALSTTTSSQGGWEVTLSGQTLPCAVQVSGGTVGSSANASSYHSVALDYGTVNLTPLSNLVVASLSQSDPATWFNGLSSGQLQAIQASAVNNAIAQIQTALGLTSTLSGINPLTTAFEPVSGNVMDDVLEALQTALGAAGSNYAALLAQASHSGFSAPSGFDFASAYHTVTQNNGGGGGGTTSCSTGETATTFAANTSVSGPWSNAQQVCFVASSTQLKFSGKTLSNPVANTVVQAPYSAYTFSDGDFRYEVVFNNGALYEINLNSGGIYYGQFTPVSSGGGGGTSGGDQPGLTFSAALGGITSLANANGSTTTTTNSTSNTTTKKTEWGDILSTVKVIVQHTVVPNYLGASYEGLTVNIAKGSPIISAQLSNSSGGVCMLAWNGSTMPSSYKLCSELGITYNRSTGAISFNNTAMQSMVGSPSSFTLNGGLNFTPY